MNNEHAYVGVPPPTEEVIEEQEQDNPTASSETHTLARPDTPTVLLDLRTPKLRWKSLTTITPIATLILAAVLALGHHAFNHLQNGKLVPIAKSVISQHLVTLVGVGFSFGFTSAIGVTMAFVRLQCLWLSVVRQPLTIKQIDTIYQIERQDQLYQTLPRALLFSQTIVIFSAITLLLPLSGVFAPGSLTVNTNHSTQYIGPCTIPTGDISTSGNPDSTSLFIPQRFLNGAGLHWLNAAPRIMALTTKWLIEQRIPDLPQACGPNCRYKVNIPSFVFQCIPNPSSLPYSQANSPATGEVVHTLWNGTTDPNSSWGFYIAWRSNGPNGTGTLGNASCSPLQAHYDVEVETKGGIQSVITTITNITSPVPDVQNETLVAINMSGGDLTTVNFWMQLASITYATRALFLGSAVVGYVPRVVAPQLADYRPVYQPSFLEIPLASNNPYPQFVWGDVLKGIEEMSHNVTAALLTLQLGNMSAECFFDEPDVVYQYTPFALWAPYGTALGIALISLVVAIMIMAGNNTGDITTSFSNTVILTRNMDEDVSAGAKLRLRAAEDGKLEYKFE